MPTGKLQIDGSQLHAASRQGGDRDDNHRHPVASGRADGLSPAPATTRPAQRCRRAIRYPDDSSPTWLEGTRRPRPEHTRLSRAAIGARECGPTKVAERTWWQACTVCSQAWAANCAALTLL